MGVGVLLAGIPVAAPPGVTQTVGDGVAPPVPVAVGDPDPPAVGDAHTVEVATTSVKNAALFTSTVHGGTPVGPVKFMVTRIILLRSPPLLAVETAKTAKPSEVVLEVTFTLPSGHNTDATAEAG